MIYRHALFNFTGSLFFVLAATGCGTVREEARDVWQTSMINEKFTPFAPPRAGIELGNIITFDEQGREFLVARSDTCLASISKPAVPRRVYFLDSSSDVTSGAGIGANFAQALKGKVDLDLLAKSTSTKKIVLSLGEPGVSEYEMLTLKQKINLIDAKSDCYKALANPKNLLVVSNLSVASANYQFKDSGDRTIKLTANVLGQAKMAPEFQQKFDGEATLKIDMLTSIGYRALAVRELPGHNKDKFIFVDLSPTEIEAYRKASIK